jgi:predicted NUDIX family NTP pyrophosphohydrolase
MPKKSAGVLAFRLQGNELQVFLVHPGGPFWAKKDAGAWSIPKGEFDNEDPLLAAKREFLEEIGIEIDGQFIALKPVTQKNGKTVHAWAIRADLDPAEIKSNTFEMEWPPKSGNRREFPEVDRAGWFSVEDATKKINPAQAGLIHELQAKLQNKTSH